jgi:hypothetical protein
VLQSPHRAFAPKPTAREELRIAIGKATAPEPSRSPASTS